MKEWIKRHKNCLKLGTSNVPYDTPEKSLKLIAEIERLENVVEKAEILCKAIVATDYRVDCFNVIIPKEMVKYLQQAIKETK